MAKTENYLRQFNIVFWANKGLILLVTILFAVVAILIAVGYPAVYSVYGTINVNMKQVLAPPEDVTRSSESAMLLPPERADVLLETRIIRSRNVVRATVRDLLNKGEKFERPISILGIFLPRSPQPEDVADKEQDDPAERKVNRITAEVIGGLDTSIEPGGTNFDVALKFYDGRLAARVLDSLLDNYLQARQLLLAGKTTPKFYEKQVTHFRDEINRLEKEKVEVLSKYRIVDFQKEIDVQMQLIRVFNEELSAAEDELGRRERDAQFFVSLLENYGKLAKPMYQPFPSNFNGDEISNMNERLNTLLYEYSQLRKVYQDEAPKVKEAAKQIEDLWKKLMVMVKSKVEYATAEMVTQKDVVARKKQKLDALVTRNQELTEGWAKLQRLDKDIELTQQNYEVFSKKYEEARIAESEQENMAASVQIINRPVEPREPMFPKKRIVIPLGVIAGFLLGFALAYIREFFDHTFKIPSEVDQHLKVPVIGSVPYRRWL